MEPNVTIGELKKQLLVEVNSLFRDDGRLWKEPIVQMLQALRATQMRAVVFGGTLRSLLLSRLYRGRPGRPRDVDVVVSGVPFREVEDRFESLITKRNRFGGLQLNRRGWQFDVWPVEDTWALRKEGRANVGFESLPSTTPFNLEAVAVDAWPYSGRAREVFSGDDQFFEGVLTKTLELNREDNPYPELTVMRALVLATGVRFRIGPKLAKYIASVGMSLSSDEFEKLQREHYGRLRLRGTTLQSLTRLVVQHETGPITLPDMGQLTLWNRDVSSRIYAEWLER